MLNKAQSLVEGLIRSLLHSHCRLEYSNACLYRQLRLKQMQKKKANKERMKQMMRIEKVDDNTINVDQV